MSKNLASLSARKGVEDNLFENLIKSAAEPVALKKLAKKYKMGTSQLLGAASAYDFINGYNADKKAYLCNGSSCLCAQTQDEVAEKLKSTLGDDAVGHVTCLGRCHENAAFQINGENYSGRDIEHLDAIIKQSFNSEESYEVCSTLENPILTAEPNNLNSYYQLFQAQTEQFDKGQLLQQIIDSGLRGRGGAGFPAGIKWQGCAAESSDQKYIVCNADEGDPGAFSDRYLLEQNPHAVLFGMLIAGYLVGAQYGLLYIRDEYPASVTAVEQAIKAFESSAVLAKDFDFRFKIIRGAGAYICGEETALLRSIEGQRPMVSVRPPFPTVKGLFEKPTVVNNVETFASVHWILEHGAAAFSAIGNGRSTGSKLISLDSVVEKPGIYEVAMGMPLTDIIDLAGGLAKPIKALHIGGPLGGLVPASRIERLTLDFESFADNGFLLGHASIVGIPQTQSIAEYICHLFAFTAAESCGKCFPCRLGATRGEEMFSAAIKGEQLLDETLLNDLLETMTDGSLCALGGGVPLPVKNAVQYFADELSPLFSSKRASHGETIPTVEA